MRKLLILAALVAAPAFAKEPIGYIPEVIMYVNGDYVGVKTYRPTKEFLKCMRFARQVQDSSNQDPHAPPHAITNGLCVPIAPPPQE